MMRRPSCIRRVWRRGMRRRRRWWGRLRWGGLWLWRRLGWRFCLVGRRGDVLFSRRGVCSSPFFWCKSRKELIGKQISWMVIIIFEGYKFGEQWIWVFLMQCVAPFVLLFITLWARSEQNKKNEFGFERIWLVVC